MVQTFATNQNNDIYIDESKSLVLLSGIKAVAAACSTISKSQLGEMVLTTTQGLPNFQSVWIGVPNLRIWQAFLQSALQNVEGVMQVTNIKITPATGKLSYQANIQTIYDTAQ
jgi:hypothetical protein